MTSETPTFAPTPPLGAAAAATTPHPSSRARKGGSRVMSVVSQILLSLVALLFLVPIIWMLVSALKPSAEVVTVPPKLFGSEVKFSNFVEAWNYLPFAGSSSTPCSSPGSGR